MKSRSKILLLSGLLGLLFYSYRPAMAAPAEQNYPQAMEEWNGGIKILADRLDEMSVVLLNKGHKDALGLRTDYQQACQKQKVLSQRVEAELNKWADWASHLGNDEDINKAAVSRLRDYQGRFEENVRQLDAVLGQVDESLDHAQVYRQLDSLTQARKLLVQLQVAQHKPLDVENLPIHAVNLSARKISPKIDQLPGKPTDDDLQTAEPVSQDIRDLITSLDNDPIKIYQWVRCNVSYIPFYGSLRNAERCFADRQGTDFDQAQLLMTMLRAADVPARLVYGRQRLELAERPDWLGVKNNIQAGELLSQGGIPYQDNSIERIWVKAYINGKWVEVDPAYKPHQWITEAAKPGDPDHPVNNDFSAEEMARLEKLLGIELKFPEADHLSRLVPTPNDGTFAAIPEGRILERSWEARAVPQEYTYRLSLKLADTPLPNLPDMAQLNNQPLDIIYLPADKLDAQILERIEENKNQLGFIPAQMVRVKPALVQGNKIIFQGEPVVMGTSQLLKLQIQGPVEGIAPVTHQLYAGCNAAVGVCLSEVNPQAAARLGQEKLEGNLLERVEGKIVQLYRDKWGLTSLEKTAVGYHVQNHNLSRAIANAHTVYALPFLSEDMACIAARVGYLASQPVYFKYTGLNFDLQRNAFNVVSLNGQPVPKRSFLQQQGLYASNLEHKILEQNDYFKISQAVSTAKAVLTATSTDTWQRFTSAKAADAVSQLESFPQVANDVKAALKAGCAVTVVSRLQQVGDWKGLAYVVQNPKTGACGYMIGGGLAGSIYNGFSPTAAGGFSGGANSSMHINSPRNFWGIMITLILVLAVVLLLAFAK